MTDVVPRGNELALLSVTDDDDEEDGGEEESAFPPPAIAPDEPTWRRMRVTVLKLGKVLTAKLQARQIFFMGELADRAKDEVLAEACGMTDTQRERFGEACEKFYRDQNVGDYADAADNSADTDVTE